MKHGLTVGLDVGDKYKRISDFHEHAFPGVPGGHDVIRGANAQFLQGTPGWLYAMQTPRLKQPYRLAVGAYLSSHASAYLAFEQLRYEERLKVDLKIDPESFNFDIPPFSMQTLAENAVHHAISVRPEGGSLWIECSCQDDMMRVTVRDDGPGRAVDGGPSHQFGLRSLRERLRAAYGPTCNLQIKSGANGFEASFVVPRSAEPVPAERKKASEPQ